MSRKFEKVVFRTTQNARSHVSLAIYQLSIELFLSFIRIDRRPTCLRGDEKSWV